MFPRRANASGAVACLAILQSLGLLLASNVGA